MTRQEIYTQDAQLDDAPALYAMQRTLAEHTESDLDLFGITEGQIRETIVNEQSWAGYHVARRQGEHAIMGMMLSSKVGPSFTGKYGVYVEDLFVEEEHRHGTGVGTLLLAHACRRAIEFADGDKERAFVRLDTSKNNNDDTIAHYLRRKFDGHNSSFRLYGDALVDLSNFTAPEATD